MRARICRTVTVRPAHRPLAAATDLQVERLQVVAATDLQVERLQVVAATGLQVERLQVVAATDLQVAVTECRRKAKSRVAMAA